MTLTFLKGADIDGVVGVLLLFDYRSHDVFLALVYAVEEEILKLTLV